MTRNVLLLSVLLFVTNGHSGLFSVNEEERYNHCKQHTSKMQISTVAGQYSLWNTSHQQLSLLDKYLSTKQESEPMFQSVPANVVRKNTFMEYNQS